VVWAIEVNERENCQAGIHHDNKAQDNRRYYHEDFVDGEKKCYEATKE
jgi:hypothetical protein